MISKMHHNSAFDQSAKGGHPPGNVRFQQPFAWAASMESTKRLPVRYGFSFDPTARNKLLIDWSFFMFAKDHTLASVDPELFGAIQNETPASTITSS
jgi:hypothetical protein